MPRNRGAGVLVPLFLAVLFLLGYASPAFSQADSGASCTIDRTVGKVVTATSYTVLLTDQCKMLVFDSATAVAVTLPDAGTTFPHGWRIAIRGQGAGVVTVTPVDSTINGSASPIAITQGAGLDIWTNNGNYYTQSGGGGSGGLGLCFQRAITSGATDALVLASDCQVLWNSATASNKTQNIPQCTAAATGRTYWITDEIQSASLYSIAIVPAAGTINGGANVVIEASGIGLMLRCNAAAGDWVAQ